MDEIFHEKQEGSLCAQHCLNALLQAPYFTAVDLATLASQIDEEERSQMAEGGTHSEDYRKFVQQPSSNVDDSGYFSVQVIARALKVWGLELIPYKSQCSLAEAARMDPVSQKCYICNFKDHWLTIRKIGHQWFNLNSLLTGPELISNTYLALILAQLQQEGYSIFIVDGNIPETSADKILRHRPCVQTEKPSLIGEHSNQHNSSEEEDLKNAMMQSLTEMQLDPECLEAVQMSLLDYENTVAAASRSTPQISNPICERPVEEMSEQEMIEAAIKMSMEA